MSCCGQKDHPFRHPEFERALDIFHHKLRFDGDRFGLKAVDELFDSIENDPVAIGQTQVRRGADAAKAEGFHLVAHLAYNAIASDAGAGIDSEDDSGFFIHEVLFTKVADRPFVW